MKYRQLYKKYYGIEFGADYEVHHIDMNHSNNSINNLILLPKELHRKLHQASIDTPYYDYYKSIFTFSFCSNQMMCDIIASDLEAIIQVYKDLRYWACCKEMEDISIKSGYNPTYYNYNQFRNKN